jgi:hypothetical protein
VRRYAALCLALLLTGCTAASPRVPADDPPLSAEPEPSGPAPSFSRPPEVFKPFGPGGTVVTAQTLGQSPGAGAGPDDLTSTLLPNGYLRLFFVNRATGAVDSVLTDRQRQRFVPDPGDRLPAGAHAPRLVSRIEGGWRMYYVRDGAVVSALSPDALAFTPEPGTRLTLGEAGVHEAGAFLSGAAVVRLASSGYRMYLGVGHPGDAGDYVLSARSTDGLAWTMDPGRRVGPGASRPFAFVGSDGAVALYFVARTPTPGIYQADADDGVTFEPAQSTTVPGVLNGVLVPAQSGDQWMYYTTYAPDSGGAIAVATRPED